MKINFDFIKAISIVCSLIWCLNIAAANSGSYWELTDDGVLTIFRQGNMPNFSHDRKMIAPWDSNKDDIKKVIIKKGTTSIGGYAFWYCKNLESIEIPNGITAIAYNAFMGCKKLTNIEIPSGCTTLGDCAFSGCSSLKKIEIPTSVTYIGVLCFNGCSSLLNITIPEGITEIKSGTFSGCNNIKEINLPNTITNIGSEAFEWCSSIEEIKLPENVEIIGKNVFSYCNNLKILNIPSKVTTFGSSCFHRTNNIQRINIDDFSAWCQIDFKGAGEGEFPVNKLYINNNPISLENLIIPDNVKKIGNYAFGRCEEIQHLKIPNSVTSIGEYAFYGCKSLIDVEFPSKLSSIKSNSFSYCEKINHIEIPESCTSIDDYAFAGCKNLNTITIPSTCSTIYRLAFGYCDKITDIYCKTQTPPNIFPDTFTKSTFQNAILHVSSNTKKLYQEDDIWRQFEQISENGEKPEVSKCDTPTISYRNGKLVFHCNTPNVTYNYDIKNGDAGLGLKTTERYVTLLGKYFISAYATADGYKPSDIVTGTLYWIDGDLQTDNINHAKTRGVVASCHDGFISISGLENNETVRFFSTDGKLIGSQQAINGEIQYAIDSSTPFVIAKIKNSSIKIAIQ